MNLIDFQAAAGFSRCVWIIPEGPTELAVINESVALNIYSDKKQNYNEIGFE